jgi:hydroxymethylbilane synthase
MLLRIGTRGSRLALTQSEWIKNKIETRHPDVRVELVQIKTRGDKILDSPLSRIGGKGLFVKEIEEALLDNRVDLAVHSIKDVPAELPQGLCIPVFPEREDPRDAFISINEKEVERLPMGAYLGTGSLRRSSQLLNLRPDINIVPLRGNVDTRLGKLDSGNLQGIILASAGLNRLGLSSRISQHLPVDKFLPAIGQGALGLEIRQDDERTYNLLEFLNHEETEIAVRAERAFLKELEGGCQIPVAAFGTLDRDSLTLKGMVAELDGSRILRREINGFKDRPEETGITLARQLLDAGAREILDRIYFA